MVIGHYTQRDLLSPDWSNLSSGDVSRRYDASLRIRPIDALFSDVNSQWRHTAVRSTERYRRTSFHGHVTDADVRKSSWTVWIVQAPVTQQRPSAKEILPRSHHSILYWIASLWSYLVPITLKSLLNVKCSSPSNCQAPYWLREWRN